MTDLLAALGLTAGGVVALCGAGGKTTLAHAMRTAARRDGRSVVLTATTHCGLATDAPVVLESAGAMAVARALESSGEAQVVAGVPASGRARGLTAAAAGALGAVADLVVVEADGARGRLLKAPAPHEPVLPNPCHAVVVVCSLAALGRRLVEAEVHRLDRVLALCGRPRGDEVDLAVLVAAFGERGYGAVAERGRRRLFIAHGPDTAPRILEALADRLAPHYSRIVAGDARTGAVALLAVSSPS